MNQPMSIYTSKEGSSGIITDTDITSVAAFAALFSTVGISKNTIIRTDAAITVRLNSVTNDAISLAANERFEIDWLNVAKIFITAAAAANLKIAVAR
jgi:hypothetical protein